MPLQVSVGFSTRLLQNFPAIFANGVIEIRSGVQPATANHAATGALLALVLNSGIAHTPGSPFGLNFVLLGQSVVKAPGESWVLKGVAAGAASWFRLKGNAADGDDASITAPRIDGAVLQRPGDDDSPLTDFGIVIPSLAITDTTERLLDQFMYAIPPIL